MQCLCGASMTSASDTDKLDWQLWECAECLRIAIESDYEGVQFYQQEKEGREQVCLRCLGSGKVDIIEHGNNTKINPWTRYSPMVRNHVRPTRCPSCNGSGKTTSDYPMLELITNAIFSIVLSPHPTEKQMNQAYRLVGSLYHYYHHDGKPDYLGHMEDATKLAIDILGWKEYGA